MAMEITPGGFVVERGVISAESPIDIEAGATETVETVVEPAAEPPSETSSPLPPDIQEPLANSVTLSGAIAGVALDPAVIPASVIDMPLPAEQSVSVPPYIGSPVSGAPIPTPGDEVPTVGTAPPYILPPTEAYAGQELHMITVILRPGMDKVRDNLRLRQCYGILISYSGHDRFALQIFERTRGYRIEFPNYTTMFCAELVARLGSIVGADNIIVEALRLH